MLQKYIAWIIFFRVVFLSIIFTNSRKSAIGFTPGVFQGVYFKVFISFVHSFGIIVKDKIRYFISSKIGEHTKKKIQANSKIINMMQNVARTRSKEHIYKEQYILYKSYNQTNTGA